MKKRFIIANWKSYKTSLEAKEWLQEISNFQFPISDETDIIVCPSFTLLPEMHRFITEKNMPLKLGTQDISQFGEGAYTGAINVKQAAECVTHAIVGHSERRKYFHETDEDVLAKVKVLVENNLTPILCISDVKQLEYYLKEETVLIDQADKIIFVYEPPSAISGGEAFHAESPDVANENAGKFSEMIGKSVVMLYGGSVNPENASDLFVQENIDGGLVGQASLDADKFMQIIKAS